MTQDAPKRRFLSLIFLVSCISKSFLTHNIVMKNGKTRLNHVFRKFLLKQFETMWGKISALYALIREVKFGIQIGIQIRV